MFGADAQCQRYQDLPYNRRKFVQFCLAEHSEDIPLVPMFPVRLATVIRYAWWLQYHGVRGGMQSIRNYVAAVTEWAGRQIEEERGCFGISSWVDGSDPSPLLLIYEEKEP